MVDEASDDVGLAAEYAFTVYIAAYLRRLGRIFKARTIPRIAGCWNTGVK